MILKTPNLILRPWKSSDAECLYNLAKNPKIGPIAGWPPHESVEDSLNIINTVFAKKETYSVVLDDILLGVLDCYFILTAITTGVITQQNLDTGLVKNIGEEVMHLKHQKN